MFDLSLSEVMLIVVVAVIFIGPKELPVVIRGLAKAMRAIKSLANEIRQAFDEVTREAGLKDVEHEMRMIQGDDGKMYEAFDMAKLPQATGNERKPG